MDRTPHLASPDRRTAVRGRASATRRVLATVALAGIAALATPGARAQSTDSWVGADKAKHFGLSAPLGMFGSALIPRDATLSQRVMYGTLLGSLPGLAKELSDRRKPGNRCLCDRAGRHRRVRRTASTRCGCLPVRAHNSR